MKQYIFILFFITITYAECDAGFVEINNLCFHEGDFSVIQKMIDNSYQSGIDLGCSEWDDYCGSPNPYMDDPESWFSKVIDGVSYDFANGNGIVEPLELGMQEWQNGRLKTIMCGAYIYCQLSGPIPEEINTLTELEVFRVEGNYFNGFIPESICEFDLSYNDYLAFDVGYNYLCPPYPDCLSEEDIGYQDTSECIECSENQGDLNSDSEVNILDILIMVNCIFDNNCDECSDIDYNGTTNIQDCILLVNLVLGQ